jgi:hypothetical protein
MIAPHRIIADDPDLLPNIRELYSRHPEYLHHEAWELQWVLFALRYTDHLAPEDDIAAAIEVARTDVDPDKGAA